MNTNSQSNNLYDVAVIGGGTAGLVSSFVASSLGAKVVLIERERVGGECLWTGCVPSKTLIKSARVYDTIKRAAEFGVHVEKPRLVWNAIKLRIQDVQDDIRANERKEIESASIKVVIGVARFRDNRSLLVQTNGGEQVIEAKKVIITAGSQVRLPDIPGLSDAEFLTHETIFDLPSVPRSLVIIGGGPVACEFAQAFARFDSKVTVLQKDERLLPKEDEEVSAAARRLLEQEGVAVHTGVQVTEAATDEDGRSRVAFTTAEGNTENIQASRILLATGKTYDFSALNLHAAGVQADESGIAVDDTLRTTAPNIWACGDATGKYLFTHVAEYQAKLAAQNALLPLKTKADYRVVPWTTFTDPEISHLGLTEIEARQEYGECRVYRSDFKSLDRAIIEGETTGFLKVVTTVSGRIVGAHIVGPSAGELIHAFVPAVRDGALIQEMAEAIHVYPTLSEIAHRAGYEYFRELQENKTVQSVLKLVVRGSKES